MSVIGHGEIKNEHEVTLNEYGIDVDVKSEIFIEDSKIECNHITNNCSESDVGYNNVIDKAEDKSENISQIFIRNKKLKESFKCPQCNTYSTYYKKNLYRHLKQHGERQKLTCTFCEKEFYNKRSLHGHIVKSHSNEKYEISSKIHNCEFCKFQTIVKEEFSRHILREHSQDINSKPCDIQLNHTSADNIETEIKIEHNDIISKYDDPSTDDNLQREITVKKNKRHVCDYCGYQTDFKRAIKEHISVHNKEISELFKCAQCNFSTYYKISLLSHIKRHGKREKINCTFCNKEFYHKRVLHNHLLKYHPNEEYEITSKFHTCKLCTYKTTERKEITRHMRRHSQDIHPKHCVTLAYDCSCHKSIRKQFFQCLQCKYHTERLSEFQRHLRNHSKQPVAFNI